MHDEPRAHSVTRSTFTFLGLTALSALACMGPCFLSEPDELDVSLELTTLGPGEIGDPMVLDAHQIVRVDGNNGFGVPFTYDLTTITSSNPTVLSVQELTDDTFRMDALATGTAGITLTGIASNSDVGSTDPLTLSLDVRVEVPATTTLVTPCAQGGEGAFLTDTVFTIDYTFLDGAAQPMQGIAAPFDLDAIAPFELNGFDGFEIDLTTPEEPGDHTLRALYGEREVSVRTVDIASIDGVAPTAEDGIVYVRLFRSDPVEVALTAQGATVCGDGPISYTLTTVDHDQCRRRSSAAVPFGRLPSGALGDEIDVNIRRQGTCELDLVLTEREDPLRVTFEVRITD